MKNWRASLADAPIWVKILAAGAFPALATLIGLAPGRVLTINAAMLYLLAVVAAALVSGLKGGLFASVLSFVGLNFFFTAPFKTLAVQKGEDFLALVSFLIVSSLVATLLTQFRNQKQRAAGTQQEASKLAAEATVLADATRRSQSEAESSRIRAALFSSVTHDLRTPLASIKASATSLLEEGVVFNASQSADLLRTIAEESDRLNRLISNLLDLSRLRAGALVPDKQTIGIEDVIEGVVARLQRSLRDVGIRIQVKDGIPLVPIDVMQIDQLLTNVIENAAKYAPEGSEIAVTVGKWQTWVEVEVADRGPGIKSEDREKVFEEFYTVPGNGLARQTRSGVGLGLSISRAIAQAHGGSMWIHETPGGGATVGFRVPTASP